MSAEYFGHVIPFAAHCGVEPVEQGEGHAYHRLALERKHENSFGVAHGGVVLTLLDMALGAAARSVTPPGRAVMTVDMQSAFLAPGRGTLHARGRVTKAGRTLIFAEGEVTSDDGELLARATGLFRVVLRRDGGSGGDA